MKKITFYTLAITILFTNTTLKAGLFERLIESNAELPLFEQAVPTLNPADKDSQGNTALHLIASTKFDDDNNKAMKILKFLFENGFDLNEKNNDGRTAYEEASKNDCLGNALYLKRLKKEQTSKQNQEDAAARFIAVTNKLPRNDRFGKTYNATVKQGGAPSFQIPTKRIYEKLKELVDETI